MKVSMKTGSQKSTNRLFGVIVGIFFVTISLTVFLFINIFPYLKAVVAPLLNNEQVACDCAHHTSLILSSPYHGGTMIALGTLLLVFMVYIIVTIVRKMYVTRKFITDISQQSFKPSRKLAEVAASIGIEQSIKEFDNGTYDVYCIGLFRPIIFSSSILVDSVSKKQLRAILLHEKNHLRHFDPFRLLVVSIVRQSLWLLPGIKQLAHQFVRGVELVADECATNNLRDIKPLSLALIKLLSLQSDTPPVYSEDVVLSPLSVTEERIDRLLNTQTPIHFKWHFLRVAGGLIVLLFFGTVVLNSHMVFAQSENFGSSMMSSNSGECLMSNAWQDQMTLNQHQTCETVQTVCQEEQKSYPY